MEKKTYKKPTAKVVELDTESLLAQSEAQAPSRYSINYDDEDGEDGIPTVPTVRNSIWDR